MLSRSRLINRIAIALAALWVLFAVLIAIELIGHWMAGTSDARSQLWRAIFILMFGVSAISCYFRFFGWRWVVILPCFFIAIRDYSFLMVPLEIYWGSHQIVAAVRLAVAVATIAAAALWGRLGRSPSVRDKAAETSANP